jgi:hypothetical protein
LREGVSRAVEEEAEGLTAVALLDRGPVVEEVLDPNAMPDFGSVVPTSSISSVPSLP